jgi:hypothetical protein
VKLAVHFWLRRLRLELPVQEFDGTWHLPNAFILGQPSPARPHPQSLQPYQPLDPMQAACDAFRQQIQPDTTLTIGPVAGDKGCLDRLANLNRLSQASKPDRDTALP